MKKLTFTFLAIAMSIAVFAADQVVTSNADAGDNTLRQAIIDAGDGDKITFNLTSGNEEIQLLSILLVDESLTIDGANTGSTISVTITRDASVDIGLFHIPTTASGKTITLKNMEMKDGLAKSTGAAGGAIWCQAGTLNIDHVRFNGNSTEDPNGTSAYGGALSLKGGTVDIANSTFDANTTESGGGAMEISGAHVTITGCTFTGNNTVTTGGAIVFGSTFNDNTSSLSVTNSTFDNNTAADGGAIYVISLAACTVDLNFNTIHENTATTGGGIYIKDQGNPITVSIKNCMLANNGNNDFHNLNATITDNGYNIVETSSGFTFNAAGDITGEQANLFGTAIATQTLAHNGGPTQTLEIEHGSVALGAGVADATTDQRGVTRAAPPTIGSYEYVSTTYAWTGTTSTDWATATNWDDNSVPAAHDDVVIPAAPTNQPVVATGTTDAVCHDLWIHAGATLTVNGKLTFHHNVNNYGALSVNGEMEFAPEPPIVLTVTSANGKIWMDRNLGATRVAQSSIDAAAYGDLYQWGRATEGHESRTSVVFSSNATTAVPNAGNPWDGKFIAHGSTDWLTPKDNTLWQVASGTNNPCPTGFRLPTETEWDAERNSWATDNTAGAFGSPLNLTVGGFHNRGDGSIGNVYQGYYWSSSTSTEDKFSQALNFNGSESRLYPADRAYGFNVRCIKD